MLLRSNDNLPSRHRSLFDPQDSFSVAGDLKAWWRQGMSKGGIWGGGVLLSAVLEGWERTVRVCRRLAVRVVNRLLTIRQENSFAVARPTNHFKTVQIDLGGG